MRAAFIVLLAVSAAVLGLMAMSDAPPALEPFFDSQRDEPIDPTPPAPRLGAFDEAVIALCGGWGDAVEEKDFLSLLHRFPQERDLILKAGRLKDEKNLSQIWFRKDGFRHIFCGEPEGKTLGGMHWVGRYRQAQAEGWAGMAPECPRQEIAPPVYTIGIRYRRADGRLGTKCPGGYAYTETAVDILADVTAAAVKARSRGKVVCLGRGRSPESTFPLVVVLRDGALVTAYPDVTPPDRPACGE